MIRIDKGSGWDEVLEKLQALKEVISEEIAIAFEEAAEEAVSLLKGHIENQDLGWKPLSDEYLMQKAKQGFAQETLIRSGKMYESITSNAGEGGFWAGISDGEQTDTGESMSMIAAVHEFGADSVGIEARPLYQPTLNELKEWMKKNLPLDDRIIRRLQK